MKLYAQIGHALGDKLSTGLDEKLVDGGIFSPKDLQRETLGGRVSEIRKSHPKADILIDPQFYVSLYANAPDTNAGHLPEWDYFRGYRKSKLELADTVRRVLGDCLRNQAEFDVTGLIAPNIFISQSLDSREAVIAKSFVREARDVYSGMKDKRPLYASLIICREALQDHREFEEFINDITVLENPPDGIYLVIAGRSSDARSDFFHTDVIANWMLLNLSLSVNGMRIINGYSDILTPFLGVAGGTAGSTGWYSNLRMFSKDRFSSVGGGGRLPIIRYLSKLLLNRVTTAEKDAITNYVPGIINKLPHDADYKPAPERAAEVFQSWEALRSLTGEIVATDMKTGLRNGLTRIEQARQAYAEIAANEIHLDMKSRDDHLEPMTEALVQFKARAGLS